MSKSNKKFKFGTYSYDGLQKGLINLEWTEEEFSEAKIYISRIHDRIKDVFEKEIYRIEFALKDELRIIPKSIDFAIWHFDNLPIRKQKQPIEIDDNEIIKYTKIYLQEFKKLMSDYSEKQNDNLKSFNWITEIQKLENLYLRLLEEEFVSNNTTLETFKNIFSNSDLNTITDKIIWLKISRNRHPSKRSISDLIIVLQENKLVEQVKDNIPKILSNCFKSKTSDLNFTHSNLSNSKGYSEYRTDLERIIKSL